MGGQLVAAIVKVSQGWRDIYHHALDHVLCPDGCRIRFELEHPHNLSPITRRAAAGSASGLCQPYQLERAAGELCPALYSHAIGSSNVRTERACFAGRFGDD